MPLNICSRCSEVESRFCHQANAKCTSKQYHSIAMLSLDAGDIRAVGYISKAFAKCNSKQYHSIAMLSLDAGDIRAVGYISKSICKMY
jgi:hypothetical protein